MKGGKKEKDGHGPVVPQRQRKYMKYKGRASPRSAPNFPILHGSYSVPMDLISKMNLNINKVIFCD